jgi:hypothetical protein
MAFSFRNGFGSRAASLAVIVVLVFLPTLTRVRQKLELLSPASHGPSLSKNVDCPPKKVTVAPVVALASPVLHETRVLPAAPPWRDLPVPLPLAPSRSTPGPLRAPPAALFA